MDKSTAFEFTNMSLLQAGLFPTFYQFTESIIEVKMAISAKTSSEFSLEAHAEGGFACFSASVVAEASSAVRLRISSSTDLCPIRRPSADATSKVAASTAVKSTTS